MRKIASRRRLDKSIDQLEVALIQHGEPIHSPVTHRFVPGMYIREIFMPKGKDGIDHIITSMVHNTTHPYVVLKGKVAVISENDGEQIIEAPFKGITRPGTRRVLKIIEDTIWLTFHKTDIVPKDNTEAEIEKAVNLIGAEILEPYHNKIIGGRVKNNKLLTGTKKSRIFNKINHLHEFH